MSPLSFRYSLIGPWTPFDPSNPLPGDGLEAARAELASYGLSMPVIPTGATLIQAATLTAVDDPDDLEIAMPIFASVVVLEHRGSVKTRRSADGDILPHRRVRRRTYDWPGDVGKVSFHEVEYTVPFPEAPIYVTLTFTTPNLTRIDEMDWVFDAIVGTAEWVEPLSPEEEPEPQSGADH